jgi:hypothetical protein
LGNIPAAGGGRAGKFVTAQKKEMVAADETFRATIKIKQTFRGKDRIENARVVVLGAK